MKKNTLSPLHVLLFSLILIFQFSCSKDSDLLAELVISETQEATDIGQFIVDDTFFIASSGSITLDVLANDAFENTEEVVITETTTPANGTVEINNDNTLIYTPDPAVIEQVADTTNTTTEEVIDTFTYTTEVVNEDESVSTETGNVTVTVNTNNTARELSASVADWKIKFDEEWTRAKSYYTNQTVGPETGNQRRYYDFRVIDGLIYMFQATGDTKYIDNFFWYVDRIKSEARPGTYHNDSYLDWEVPWEGKPVAFQLYDGHGLRNVFKMLWLLKKYPEIRSMSNYQEKYDEYLSWFTTNLWDKWKSRGNGSILRSNTHMASHMASNMALYLYLLETDQAKKDEYISWVNAWNNNVDSKRNWGGAAGTGFRDQLRLNDPHDGYVWAGPWGNMTSSNDITHTNAEVQSVINQHHQGIEWTSADIQLFLKTLNNMMDAGSIATNSHPFFINLNTNSKSVKTFSYGWAMLGRYDEATQQKLKDFSISRNQASYYHNSYLGIMAFNRAYLDGSLIYPEF